MGYPNPIWVSGRITPDEFFQNFTLRLSDLLQSTKQGDQITVFINSSGGDTNTTLGVYDILVSLDRNVVGIVAGRAHSGASLVLQACTRRCMTPHSNLMLHKSSVEVKGSVENAQRALDVFSRLDEKFYEIYAARSGEMVDLIADMAHRDQYFTPEEALAANLIDEII